MQHQILLFYKYVTISDPEAEMEAFRALAQKYQLLGRALIASEGINATLEGEVSKTEAFVKEFLKHPLFKDISIKRSKGTGTAFPKLKVKVRNQIVGTHFSKEEADPEKETAPHLTPEELRAWYERGEDFVVVDMRNDYEYEVGHFKNSINPGLKASRDLKEKVKELEPLKNKKVVTVCTGGVRCEPMAAYLQNKGFEEVYQLEDGMHAYMEKYPGKDFLGALYTFDGRIVMDFGGEREIVGTCRFCKAKTEQYVNCANPQCNAHFLVCNECDGGGTVFCGEVCANTVTTLAEA